jgi:hypothetical protein
MKANPEDPSTEVDLDAEYLTRRAFHNGKIEELIRSVPSDMPHLESDGVVKEQLRRIQGLKDQWYEPLGTKKHRNDYLLLLPEQFKNATESYKPDSRHSAYFKYDYPNFFAEYKSRIQGRTRKIVNGNVLKWSPKQIVDFLACMDACAYYIDQLRTKKAPQTGKVNATKSGKQSVANTERYEARQALHVALALMSSIGPPDQILSVNKSQLSRILMSLTGISTDTFDRMIPLALSNLDHDGNNNLSRVRKELANLKLNGIRMDFIDGAIKRDPTK